MGEGSEVRTYGDVCGCTGVPETGHCASLLSPTTGVPQLPAVAGALSIVDAVFECDGCALGHTAIATQRNLYLRRTVVMSGIDTIARVFDATESNATVVLYTLPNPAGRGGTTTVHELSLPVPVNPPKINSTAYIDGVPVRPIVPHGPVLSNITADGDPAPPKVRSPRWKYPSQSHPQLRDGASPDDACDRHGWGDNFEFPSPASTTPGMVSVRDHGAVGDGVVDDTEAVQAAVNAGAVAGIPVFFPRGVFRVCASIVVPRGAKVVGLARHLVQLVADDRGFGGCGGNTTRMAQLERLRAAVLGPDGGGSDGPGNVEPAYDQTPPILLYSNRAPKAIAKPRHSRRDGGLGSLLFGITLFVPLADRQTNASHWAWRSGVSTPGSMFNVYRQGWQTRRPPCGEWLANGCSARRNGQLPYAHAYVRIEGEAATLRVFVFYQEDGLGNSGAETQSPFRRKLLVNGTRSEVAFYQLNGEHSASTAYSEFVNTSGVAVYGCKSESSGTLTAVLFVRSSTDFASYGHGGAAHVSATPIGPESCNGMAPCPWPASLYRVLDSDNVRLVNLQGQFYAGASTMLYEQHNASSCTSRPGDWPAIWFRSIRG